MDSLGVYKVERREWNRSFEEKIKSWGEKNPDASQRTEAKDLKKGRNLVSQNFFTNP